MCHSATSEDRTGGAYPVEPGNDGDVHAQGNYGAGGDDVGRHARAGSTRGCGAAAFECCAAPVQQEDEAVIGYTEAPDQEEPQVMEKQIA